MLGTPTPAKRRKSATAAASPAPTTVASSSVGADSDVNAPAKRRKSAAASSPAPVAISSGCAQTTPRRKSAASASPALAAIPLVSEHSTPVPAPDRPPWRGVSLGGWLLLEPGPAKKLFSQHRDGKGEEARCEWELMKILRQKGDTSSLLEHRETYICKKDLERIRDIGLNSVRVPFGYWVVLGSLGKDPYDGPALQFLDRAVDWAEELGLQVLLDLHGCPGGESAEAPCGHRQRPAGRWKWRQWRFRDTLRALDVVAKRYCKRKAVTGVAVCNEPSPEVPSDTLCRFYSRAIETIRNAGMQASEVTIVLPVFQRSLSEFAAMWMARTRGKYENTCFEVHWYHCFENEWHGRTFAQHLRAVEDHSHELHQYPVVVGEWSLALGCGAQPGKLSREEMRALFALFQLAAYGEASHGWFFWTWSDPGGGAEWDLQRIHHDGHFPLGAKMQELPKLPPPCEDTTKDPVERVFDVPSSNPRVYLGDTVYLRVFNGRYIDVEGTQVRARYGDRGKWQQLVLCPFEAGSAGSGTPLRDGDVVCLLAHNGHFLGVKGRSVAARWSSAEEPCALVVRTVPGQGQVRGGPSSVELRHRCNIFLQSRSTSKMIAPNEGDPTARDAIIARWNDFGTWQRIVIEKPLSTAVTPHRPRRRSSFPGTLASPATPSSRRRFSLPASSSATQLSPKRRRRISAPAPLSSPVFTPSRQGSLRRAGSKASLADETPGTPSARRRHSTPGVPEPTPLRSQSVPRQSSSSVSVTDAGIAFASPAPKQDGNCEGISFIATPSRRRSSAASTSSTSNQ